MSASCFAWARNICFARATVVTAEIALVAFLILRFIVPMMQRKEHQLLNFILLAVCIAALFQVFILRDSLSQRLQRWLDRKFFREAYNSEVVLSELSEQVRQLTDRNVLFDIVLRRISEVLHVSQIAILLRGSKVFHLQQALGMDFGGPVALAEESATIQNLLRTNQPATVYRDRPEEWFTDAGAEEKALLREINAELLLPMSGRAELIRLDCAGTKEVGRALHPDGPAHIAIGGRADWTDTRSCRTRPNACNQAAQRERMNREIEIAREVQQRLFPQSIPQIAGVAWRGCAVLLPKLAAITTT
jgi:sigma-B regulation protein RsbU (phosphoserine phosphatase)